MKIQSYPNDNSISLQDKVTGTDADDGKKTKNYTFQAIKDFFIAQGFGLNSSTTPSENTLPYKVYTALISQTGTSNPTVLILENTIGNIVWSRNSIGAYFGTPTSAFTINKTVNFITPLGANSNIYGISRNGDNVIVVRTRDFSGEADGILDATTIEIRLYN